MRVTGSIVVTRRHISRPFLVAAGLALASVQGGVPVGGQSVQPDFTVSGVGWDSAFVEQVRQQQWLLHGSDTYGYLVGYPPGWTVQAAERPWTFEADATDRSSPAMVDVTAPDGDARVSVWSVPLETVPEHWGWVPVADFVPWVESWCEATGNEPCTGILERAVPLCLERWDCHPGVLVPFEDAMQAFFSAGIYAQDEMVIVSVWGGRTDPALARYGGRQALLEDFLSAMMVWPQDEPKFVHDVPKAQDVPEDGS
jgi:hypothetical protein